MPRDAKKLLHDVRRACQAILSFCQDRSLDDYLADLMLRSACERQLEIVGEAMTRLRDHHQATFASVTHGAAIIAFRNRLIHGYDSVDSEIVWDVIDRKIAELETAAASLIAAGE